MSTRRTVLTLLVLAAATIASGCDDATGSLKGGDPLFCPPSDGSATWTALYADYFGPCGSAGCSGQSYCHSSNASTGSQISGFTCGNTQESCWAGIAEPIDGSAFPPIATSGQLMSALHKAAPGSGDLDNMPCGGGVECLAAASTYSFTSADLARISAWIQQGAQDN